MTSREEFAQLVAAVCAIYTNRLEVKVGKTTLRQKLHAACQPDRAEWYFNSIRHRSRITAEGNTWLGSGTSHNEALHRLLNAHYRPTTNIGCRMLNAQLQTWNAAEMATFLNTMATRTTIKLRRGSIRPLVLGTIQLFSQRAWSAHVGSPLTVTKSGGGNPQDTTRSRPGPSTDQSDVYNAIMMNTIPRKRIAIYRASSAQKNMRTPWSQA